MGESVTRASLVNYFRCLRDNPHYRNLWIADFVDNIGAWLNYVATLELVEQFSGGSGLAVTAVILIRFFPSLVLSPVAGVLADRCNRIVILVVAALIDAVLVAALAFVQRPSQAPLLYILLAAQFTAIALQDPARKAIVPVLVPKSQLHLATTLETFSWSLTGAVGAAAGGAIASRLGNSACFLIDAATYFIAAWCASKVPRALGDPEAYDVSVAALKKSRSGLDPEVQLLRRKSVSADEIEDFDYGAVELAPLRTTSAVHHHKAAHREQNTEVVDGEEYVNNNRRSLSTRINRPADSSPTLIARSHTTTTTSDLHPKRTGGTSDALHVTVSTNVASLGKTSVKVDIPRIASLQPQPGHNTDDVDVESFLRDQPLRELPPSSRVSPRNGSRSAELTSLEHGSGPLPPGPPPGSLKVAVGSLVSMAWASLVDGVGAAWEGWQYITSKDNRDVAALVLMKGCGSVTWGAVDVLNVRFSELPDLQIGDGPTTLGLIFAVVGTGCFLGPVILNAVVRPQPRPLLWACAASFILLFLGTLMMSLAHTMKLVLAATFVRSVGSSTLWIYSTLLLQLRTPNSILGRISAVEMAWYTVAEAGSSVFGGAAEDVFVMTASQTAGVLAGVAGVLAAGWVAYAWMEDRRIHQSQSITAVSNEGEEEP